MTAAMPEKVTGKLFGDERVKVTLEFIREKGINSARSPELLRNLIGKNLDSTVFFFRDVPEVWTALGVQQ